jgi:muramidase (phage lysozyme)
MLDLIAWAEGTNNSYNISYTGAKFESFDNHPRQLYCSRGICSDAAGRYQFLSTTWQPLANALNLPDFSPASQDKAAIELMKRCGGYGAAVRGDVKSFVDRCYTQWASLRSSDGKRLDSRQKTHSIPELTAKYNEFRGSKNFIKPLSSMRVTSPMLPYRIHPVTGELRPHNGTDYACAIGEIIRSPISGVFVQGNPDPRGFGNTWGHVKGSPYEITIGHTQKLLVRDGESVQAGQPIAECGSEGASTGAHLHLEIRRLGALVDPEIVAFRD